MKNIIGAKNQVYSNLYSNLYSLISYVSRIFSSRIFLSLKLPIRVAYFPIASRIFFRVRRALGVIFNTRVLSLTIFDGEYKIASARYTHPPNTPDYTTHNVQLNVSDISIVWWHL